MGRRVEDLLIERRLNGQAGGSPVVLDPEGQAADREVLLTGTGRDPERREVGCARTRYVSTRACSRAVFGDYIGLYDIAGAVEDGATVPLDCGGQLAKRHDRHRRWRPESQPHIWSKSRREV